MMFTRSYARITFLFILAFAVLLIPNLLRNPDLYLGEDPYAYSRIDKINNGYDDLSYGGREITGPSAQSLLFSFFKKILPENAFIKIIPVILALVSLYIFYLILRKFYADPNVVYLSLIFLILSPSFIYVFTSYNEFTLITTIILLSFYLYIKNDRYKPVSYALYFIIPFFGYQYSLLALISSLIYSYIEKRMKDFYIVLIVSLIALGLAYIPAIIGMGLPELSGFDKEPRYKLFFADLGSDFGISIFTIFLSFFGINYLWKLKYKYAHIYLSLILFAILAFLYPSFIIFMSFLLIYLSSLGIIYLLRSKWDSEIIRKLTMWLLIIGVLFSTITFISESPNKKPSQDLYDSLTFLRNYDSSHETVFSHYSYGALINSIADKKNVMDSDFFYAPKLNERYEDSQTLFHTRNGDLAYSIIDKYNIRYIIITREMKQGLVWNQGDEGLLFILDSPNLYKMIYQNDEVEIWRVRK